MAGFLFAHCSSSSAQIRRLTDSGSWKNSLLMRFTPFGLLATAPACRPARLLWPNLSMTECFLRFAQKHDGMLVDFCMAECRRICYNIINAGAKRGDIMPISEKKKITNSRYIAKCDSIQIRPSKDRGGEIRAAAAAAGQSVQAYILQACAERMARDGFTPAESGEEGG